MVKYNLLNILKYNFSFLGFDFVVNSTCPGPGFVRFTPTLTKKIVLDESHFLFFSQFSNKSDKNDFET